jgi:predicted O-methyltransferase YrrM
MISKIIKKIIKVDDIRKSRLHDEKGNRISWKNLVSHTPSAFATGILRLAFGYRPVKPWIAYSSVKFLKNFLKHDSRVLEFGSGMSTIWYARNAGEVFSVDDHKLWHQKVCDIIKEQKIHNITYKLAVNDGEYVSFMSEDQQGFDLVMVDGNHRSKCIEYAAKLVRQGGILYLDNSDKHSQPAGGDTRQAELLLREFAKKNNALIFEITDFAPTQFFVQQGLYAKLPD